MEYVDVPGIAQGRLEKRRYQSAMAEGCLKENSLVILPTGLGKTAVALLAAAEVLRKGRKVLMLAPTKPLVDQHGDYFSSMLPGTRVAMMTGHMPPKKRRESVEGSDFIVSTPQSVSNDLDNCIYDLEGFGLVVYDEAHRGTGNYDYVNVAKYVPDGAVSLGMTASPGSDLAKIEEVCNNLGLTRIDVRSDDDPDVSPYVHDTYVNRITVNLPKDLCDVSELLHSMLYREFGRLSAMHLTVPNWPLSKKHMLTVQGTLQARLRNGEKSMTLYRGLRLTSMCIKLLYAVELAETQGMSPLRTFFAKIDAGGRDPKGPKADSEIAKSEEYRQIWHILETTDVEHPKVSRIMSLVSRVLNSGESPKILVFAQYRETCDILAEKLSQVENARVTKLIGQANGGLKQKEQIEMLDKFRSGNFNIVVSTSVGEEGLDITSTNAVIFYEPVSSEIRTIQRRGRTGRKNDGEVYVLIAAGTMDEVVESASKKKEALMRQRLETLSRDLRKKRPMSKAQTGIDGY